jgi:SAM-dependent methyltransferase
MDRQTLSRDAARRIYDRIGKRQDTQVFYERPAWRRLRDNAAFDRAAAVVELGCGTGRLARELLADELPAGSSYRGFDISPVMVALATARTAGFADRARIDRVTGDPPLPLTDGCCDRFVAGYVLDLLAEPEIRAWVREAHRLLRPDGLLCLVAITHGFTPGSRLVMGLWDRVHRLRPAWTGGCRPIDLGDHVGGTGWLPLHHSTVVAYALPSEVLVARRV